MLRTLSILLLAGLVAPGCGAVLGLGAGVVVSQEVVDNNTYVALLNQDADIVWATTKSVLSHESAELVEVDADLRSCSGTIDGTKVTVGVEVYDLNRCRLSVSARKYGISNGEMAELVMNKIVRELEQNAS